MKPISARRMLALLLASFLATSAAAAQTPPPRGSLAGRVLDAGTGRPVPGAFVTLELATTGLLVDTRLAAGLTPVRSIVTGESGAYGFGDVAPGAYRLRIERLGYRAATVTVEVRRPAAASVSVGLELDPVALEPMRVDQRAASLFQRAANAPAERDDARIDAELGGRSRIEASGVWEEDRIAGDVTGILERTDARWGNTAGRMTLRSGVGALELAQSIGLSGFSVHTDARTVRTAEPSAAWSEPAGRNDIRHTQVAGELTPVTSGEAARWSIGYDVAFQRVDYDGPLPRYHPVKPDTTGHMTHARELLVAALYGDTRAMLGERITIQPGLRLETGDAFHDGGDVRLSPRVALRLALSPNHTGAAVARPRARKRPAPKRASRSCPAAYRSMVRLPPLPSTR